MLNFNNPDWIDMSFEELEQLDFICSICQNVYSDPIQIHNDPEEPCGHLFCMQCITSWIVENPNCPDCRAFVLTDDLLTDGNVRRKVGALSAICHINPRLCKDRGKVGRNQLWWKKHEKSCQFKTISCPFCGDELLRSELQDHVSEECPDTLIGCELGCGTIIQRNMRSGHATNCLCRLDTCKNCLKEFPIKNLPKHIDSDCPKTILYCDFNYAGCTFSCTRENYEKKKIHLKQAMEMHLHLVTSKLQQFLPHNNRDKKNNELKEFSKFCWSCAPKDGHDIITSKVLGKKFGAEWGLSHGSEQASKDCISLYIMNFNSAPARVNVALRLHHPISGNILYEESFLCGPEWQDRCYGYKNFYKRADYPFSELNIIWASAILKAQSPNPVRRPILLIDNSKSPSKRRDLSRSRSRSRSRSNISSRSRSRAPSRSRYRSRSLSRDISRERIRSRSRTRSRSISSISSYAD